MTSKPMASLTAIMCSFSAVFQVLIRAHSRMAFLQGPEVGQLGGEAQAVATVLGNDERVVLPGRLGRAERDHDFAEGDEPARSSSRATVVTLPRSCAARFASRARTRAVSHSSSSSSCSPTGTSVDMRRPNSQRSSRYSSGQRSAQVSNVYPFGAARGSSRSRRARARRQRETEQASHHRQRRSEAEASGEWSGPCPRTRRGPASRPCHRARSALPPAASRAAASTIAVATPWRRCAGSTRTSSRATCRFSRRNVSRSATPTSSRRATRHQAAVLLRPVAIERLAQAFGSLPSRQVRPPLLVHEVPGAEPFVERRRVVRVDDVDVEGDRGRRHRHRSLRPTRGASARRCPRPGSGSPSCRSRRSSAH